MMKPKLPDAANPKLIVRLQPDRHWTEGLVWLLLGLVAGLTFLGGVIR